MTIDLFPPSGDQEDESPAQQPVVYSVAEITRQIKSLLEDFPTVYVTGEISNINRHSSGHIYFTLKDDQSQIRAVVWRSQAKDLGFPIEDGMKVIIQGRLTLYERGGYYQIVVYALQPAGLGELQVAFERLKRKLFDEGLFDPEHKKQLPRIPSSIGIITSPTGAAIRDLISVIRRRMPSVQVILAPVKVQGAGAAEEIARAISDFESYGQVDVLIVGRGGGSLEDLWAFNEETVARAIHRCTIPIISAVGHEIDFTIADLVADHRSATPSVAGEEVVPNQDDLRSHLVRLEEAMSNSIRDRITQHRKQLTQLDRAYAFRQPENIIAQYRQRTDELERRVLQSATHGITLIQSRLLSAEKQLQALNPSGTLKRGYTIVRQKSSVIQRVGQLDQTTVAEIEFYDGKATVEPRKKN
ncbi:MAG: exodeoxyribonuclease VII large subunit [Bacteroidetes bacterium]|nr:exodeoxyribonuclease VII large subunit [Bacteroidota bacterium]